jgi:hypothetical protein
MWPTHSPHARAVTTRSLITACLPCFDRRQPTPRRPRALRAPLILSPLELEKATMTLLSIIALTPLLCCHHTNQCRCVLPPSCINFDLPVHASPRADTAPTTGLEHPLHCHPLWPWEGLCTDCLSPARTHAASSSLSTIPKPCCFPTVETIATTSCSHPRRRPLLQAAMKGTSPWTATSGHGPTQLPLPRDSPQRRTALRPNHRRPRPPVRAITASSPSSSAATVEGLVQ